MSTWEVRSLDVWGHEPGGPDCECGRNNKPDSERCEGYSINETYGAGSIELDDKKLQVESRGFARVEPTDDSLLHIIDMLIDGGFLKPACHAMVEIEDVDAEGSWVQVLDRENKRPIFDLMLVEDEEGDSK